MNNAENYDFSELTNQELDQALYEILKDKDNCKSIDSLKKMMALHVEYKNRNRKSILQKRIEQKKQLKKIINKKELLN